MKSKRFKFSRLYFKESHHKSGGKCWIAKLKNCPETGERMEEGTLIVLSNTTGNMLSGIDREGRWDVEVVWMKSKKGFLVTTATWTEDEIELYRDNFRVKVVINGEEEKFKTEDGKFIPLYFDCERWYDPKRIVPSILRKLEHLQVAPEFCAETFCEAFVGVCGTVEKEYFAHVKGRN